MFEQASRGKLRFETQKGLITVEDLWDLPLSGKGINLDDIAVGLYNQLRNSDRVSFVSKTSNRNDEIQLKFDVVKHVIDVKMAERDAEAELAKRKATKQRILELIAQKQDQELAGKSIEELTSLANSL
jgi:hypothetical protein